MTGSVRARPGALAMRIRTCMAVLSLAFPATAGSPSQHSEEGVKAAFLFKFTHFVEWPAASFPDAAAPYVVGILGKDPFGAVLEETLGNKRVNGRKFSIVRAESPEGLKGCHVLYVSASESGRKAEVLGALKGTGILVVGDSAGFARAGATLNFILEERRVRLEINPAASARAGLKVSSKLVQICRVVEDKPEGP